MNSYFLLRKRSISTLSLLLLLLLCVCRIGKTVTILLPSGKGMTLKEQSNGQRRYCEFV